MGAGLQSRWDLFSKVPLVAGIFSSGGLWGVSHVRQKKVEVEESSWEILADWLDDFPAVLEALLVHLEMTVLVLRTAEGRTFESRHNHLGAGHIHATVAHNFNDLGLSCWKVANFVSCWMETGINTVERMEMAPSKEGNRTLAADDIDWCVSQIECFCEWHGVKLYPVILNCRHCVVARKRGYQVEPYSLPSVEIISLTCSVKQR